MTDVKPGSSTKWHLRPLYGLIFDYAFPLDEDDELYFVLKKNQTSCLVWKNSSKAYCERIC